MKTQTQEVPKHSEALLDAYKSEEEVKKLYLDPNALEKSSLDRLPQPTGYRIFANPDRSLSFHTCFLRCHLEDSIR